MSSDQDFPKLMVSILFLSLLASLYINTIGHGF